MEQNRKCCGLSGQECKHTSGELSITEMQADHILEHSMNGTTTIDNLQMLCVDCHKEKTKKFMTKQLEVVE
jgi:5-methylcytosine-specific restriction endonuclease McrA